MALTQGNRMLLKAAIPVSLGIGVAVWLFSDNFDAATWSHLRFDGHTVAGLLLAVLFVAGRDFGLAWRFHTIASPALSLGRAFRVDLMCAFTSAITPSAVGGSALAVFYLNREGVSVGRATTLTLTTLFLDEMFFVVFCPILFLVVPWEALFGGIGAGSVVMRSVPVIFWTVYCGIVAYTALLFVGIIIKPEWVSVAIDKVFSLKLLRRWRDKAAAMTGNMVATSAWVRERPWRWWWQVFGATVVSWFSRYFVVNSLFWAFVPGVSGLLVFARQFVVWVVLMVSPTPGGSGVSEVLFTDYYGDLVSDMGQVVLMAAVWRLLSYYVYLAIGAYLIPSYLKGTQRRP